MIHQIDLSKMISLLEVATPEDELQLSSIKKCMQTLESMTSGCFYMIDYRTCRLIYTSGYIPFMESVFGKSGHTISTEDIERAIDNDERMKLVRAHCA